MLSIECYLKLKTWPLDTRICNPNMTQCYKLIKMWKGCKIRKSNDTVIITQLHDFTLRMHEYFLPFLCAEKKKRSEVLRYWIIGAIICGMGKCTEQKTLQWGNQRECNKKDIELNSPGFLQYIHVCDVKWKPNKKCPLGQGF